MVRLSRGHACPHGGVLLPWDDRGVSDTFPPVDADEKKRTVFVVHGRDKKARREVYTFLRAIGLAPMEWPEALTMTGSGSPPIGDILDKAMAGVQAIIVLQTPDDVVQLKREHADDEEDPDLRPSGQARPNVLFEAGLAFGRFPHRTVLVEFGKVRPFTDIGGRYVVKLDNSTKQRQTLALRLRDVGCAVHLDATDWHHAGDLTPPATKPAVVSVERGIDPSGHGDSLTLGNITVNRDSGLSTVYGEAVNHGAVEITTAMVKATFYDGTGRILGAANGYVSDIAPGETKIFQLMTTEDIDGYTHVKPQTEMILHR